MARAGLNLTWAVKQWFFNRDKVLALIGETAARRLGASGALVATIAQRSMRYISREKAKTTKSPAGVPPRAIREKPLLRKFIEFALDPATRTEVVGPILLPNKLGINVPRLHEYGGTVRLRNKRRRVYRVGMAGPILLKTTVVADPLAFLAILGGGMKRDPTAVYARLRTAAQADRANRLNREIYGRANWYQAVYPARPYMAPALVKARPGLARIWAESLIGPAKTA